MVLISSGWRMEVVAASMPVRRRKITVTVTIEVTVEFGELNS